MEMEILLYSGGLDSYVAWWYLGKPMTLYCRLGHRYEDFELEAVRSTVPSTVVDDTLGLGKWEEEDANIPQRNMFLVMVAAMYGADKVWLVVQKGEKEIPDRSRRFFTMASEAVSFLLGRRVKVDTPFWCMTKTQLVKWYLENVGDVDMLLKTRSCYSSDGIPCGDCPACFRRWVAFVLNGIEEKTKVPVPQSQVALQYLDAVKRGKYKGERAREMVEAFKLVGMWR